MKEVWRAIPGFEGRYEASDFGRVRSVEGRVVRCVSKAGTEFFRPAKAVVLRPGNCRGYLIVNLSPHGTVGVHRLVAAAFIRNPDELPHVNHLDGDKRNNAATNLEWCSALNNNLHAVQHGLNKQAHPCRAPSGRFYPSVAQAARGEHVRVSTARGWVL